MLAVDRLTKRFGSTLAVDDRSFTAALGAGVGATLRNQAAAIVLVLVILFVIDPVATAVFVAAAALLTSRRDI